MRSLAMAGADQRWPAAGRDPPTSRRSSSCRTRLKAARYYNGDIDGQFRIRAQKAAIAAFQSRSGIDRRGNSVRKRYWTRSAPLLTNSQDGGSQPAHGRNGDLSSLPDRFAVFSSCPHPADRRDGDADCCCRRCSLPCSQERVERKSILQLLVRWGGWQRHKTQAAIRGGHLARVASRKPTRSAVAAPPPEPAIEKPEDARKILVLGDFSGKWRPADGLSEAFAQNPPGG